MRACCRDGRSTDSFGAALMEPATEPVTVVLIQADTREVFLAFAEAEIRGSNRPFWARGGVFWRDDEGVTWIRGHHEAHTAEATALFTAHTLTRP